jgi:spore coat polysaccharide biosynthesis protein SpsF
MKTLVVVQARRESTRLPNKIMMPLAGKPLLQRMLERVRGTRTPVDLVVATTTDPSDEPVRALCRTLDVRCFSGHPTDLLDRHCRAAETAGADDVVKIPSDCPLIDPAVIDRVLEFHHAHRGAVDYTSNLHPASYPDGNDVEVIPFRILEEAAREATRPFEREHTTPYIWERPARYRLGNVAWETGLNYSMTHRWTIDYPEDYEFIRTVYDELWSPTGLPFSLGDILRLLETRPEIGRINARYAGVNWYRNHAHELTTVSSSEYRQIA